LKKKSTLHFEAGEQGESKRQAAGSATTAPLVGSKVVTIANFSVFVAELGPTKKV